MSVPFEYLEHLVVVPVTLNGAETHFILDSGIGLTLVRSADAATPTGETYIGRRMSGQAVEVPLAHAGSLAFDGLAVDGAEVGILDMSFPPQLDHIAGFLSLAFFAEQPVTVDYPAQGVELGRRDGVALDVKVEWDGPAVTVFLPLELPNGETISAEVDMGSDQLILDRRFRELGVGEARVVDGVDETGNGYTRTFMQLGGPVHPAGAPELVQDDPQVMFQEIIHDGLIGKDFLARYAVTFDLPGSRIVLA